MKILILFAHPALDKSKVNKILIEDISKLKNVTFHDLYEIYPELDFDVKKEQQLLIDHDVIIFQYPLFWFSTPAILKEWQDLVLVHGWAYGSKGTVLKDKLFFSVLTTGGAQKAYNEGSFNNHTINQFLSPLIQTALRCRMIPLPPFVIHGTHAIETEEILDYKNDYFDILQKFVNEDFDINKAKTLEYLNEYLTKEEK